MLPLHLTFTRMAGKLDLKSWHRWCSSQNPGCPCSLAPQVSQSPNLKENSTFMLLTSWATVAGKKMQCSAGCWGPCSWGSPTWLALPLLRAEPLVAPAAAQPAASSGLSADDVLQPENTENIDGDYFNIPLLFKMNSSLSVLNLISSCQLDDSYLLSPCIFNQL